MELLVVKASRKVEIVLEIDGLLDRSPLHGLAIISSFVGMNAHVSTKGIIESWLKSSWAGSSTLSGEGRSTV